MTMRRTGRLLGIASAAAIGVVAGVALGKGRKAAFNARSRLHGDWLGQLRSEHRAIRKLLSAMADAGLLEPAKRATLLAKVADALTRHALEEETTIYPALAAEDGDDDVHDLADDHADMKTLIRELQALPLEDDLWGEKAEALKILFTRHAREEEREIFPELHERLGDDENSKLTRLMRAQGEKLA